MNDHFKLAVIAKIKHGELYDAIKRRGWTLKQAAEFLGLGRTNLCAILALRKKIPFIFSTRTDDETKAKARNLTEKLMELTGKTVDDLFPEFSRSDDFLSRDKTAERILEVPVEQLLGYRETLALPEAPDEAAIANEESREESINLAIGGMTNAMKKDISGLLNGKKIVEIAKDRGVGRTAVENSLKSAVEKIQRTHKFRNKLATTPIEEHLTP